MLERDLSKQFDPIARLHDREIGEGNNSVRKDFYDPAMLEVVGDVTNLEILDIASGNGYWSRKLAERGAKFVVGVDGSGEQVAVAIGKDNPDNVTFQQGDVMQKLPFADRSFDMVFSSLTLDHPQSIQPVAPEFNRIVKPGGRVIVSVQHPFYQLGQRLREAGGGERSGFGQTAGYFDRVPITKDTPWGTSLVHHNRTVADYVTPFLLQGLQLKHFVEPEYTEAVKAAHPRYRTNQDVPRFLILGFTRPQMAGTNGFRRKSIH